MSNLTEYKLFIGDDKIRFLKWPLTADILEGACKRLLWLLNLNLVNFVVVDPTYWKPQTLQLIKKQYYQNCNPNCDLEYSL